MAALEPSPAAFQRAGFGEAALAALLGPWLRWRSRPGRLRAVLDGLTYPPAAPPQLPKVRVAAVQFDIGLAPSAEAFARHAYACTRQAVEGGAGLVIFPEYTTLPLLGLLPGAQRLAESLAQGAEKTSEASSEKTSKVSKTSEVSTMALALRLAARAASRVYRQTFSTLASRFGVTLLAGSAIELAPDGRLQNAAYLFGPDGALMARQVKTHLVPSEVLMGYGVGEEIVVADTPAGRLAFPVCMDHTYFETARFAALQGADLLIDPAANNEYYDPYAQARGVWNRVQEVQCYGVFCGAIARVAGLVFQGRSGIYAPLELTPAGDGVLAAAESVDREQVVFGDLDYEALRAYRRRRPLEFNTALYRRYLPEAYNRNH